MQVRVGTELAMSKVGYGFVVLHYMAEEMTIQSVDKLLDTFYGTNIRIVIIDNGSLNGSGKHLKKHYENITFVDVILSEENVGFAKGNNIGYRYLKKNFNPKFIIVMNNDVLINQKQFLELISEIYEKTSFGILGPDIYCPFTKLHQNPSRMHGLTSEQIRAEIILREKMEKNFALYYFKHLTLGKLKRLIMGNRTIPVDRLHEIEGSVLHGACYIFSNDFIKKRDNAFNPNTFLYFEEDILHRECTLEHIKMVYSPALKVEHLEDASTNAVFKSDYKKAKMKNREMLKSARLLDHIAS